MDSVEKQQLLENILSDLKQSYFSDADRKAIYESTYITTENILFQICPE